MPRDVYGGIDPGKAGAITIIPPGELPIVVSAPLVKNEYDPAAMLELLRPWGPRLSVAIEFQYGNNHESGKSARTSGYGFGLWIMGLVAVDAAYEIVQPSVWTRKAPGGSLVGASKGEKMLRARQLWPDLVKEFTGSETGKASGRADSALIAEFLRRRERG
jgi:hypothetical protein